MNLKNQLGFYLKRKDITVTKLAKLSSVPQQTIHDWLYNDRKNISVNQIKKVADTLNTTVDNLCWGTGEIEDKAKKSNDLNELLTNQLIGGSFEVRFIRKIKDD